jgi:WD40 repeat protein
MSDPASTPCEEELAAWLSARDEELAAGDPPSLDDVNCLPEAVQPRVSRDLECVQLLRSLWPESGSASVGQTDGKVGAACRDTIPRRIGRFEIRRELGAGGYGVVFLAFDPQLDREVALKVPRADSVLTPELRSRFRHEARIAAGLDHPNIVPIYDAGEAGPVCYIASAYCPGVTLAEWLGNRATPVLCDTAARLVACLADAVQHAHSRGVLHRDLKPGNVILAANDRTAVDSSDGAREFDFVPRLTDFGLAKLQGSHHAATRTHAVLGTAEYMSPEQAAGRSRDITTAADIYGLGVILYELVTGCPPFRAETPLATLRRLELEEPTRPSRLRPDVPRDLETIVLKCLQKEPGRRYFSAYALAEDLRRFLAGEPVEARPVRHVERVVLWCRRNRVQAALIAAVAVALISGTCVSTYFAIKASGRKQAEIAAAVAGVEAREAQAANRRIQQHLYLSRMLVAESAWENAEIQRLEEVLQSTLPTQTAGIDYRRFEWYFWQRTSHADRRSLQFDGPLYTVRFSSDGTQMAVAGELGTAWIVNATTGQLQHVLTGHSGPIWGVAFSADGKYVAAASDDATVRIWNAATGMLARVLEGHTADVTDVAFAPDDSRLASASEDGTVRVWSAIDGSLLANYRGHSGPVWGVVFSKDGMRILSSADDAVHVWDSHTGVLERTLTGHDGPVYAADITADGDRIATASEDRSVRLWSFSNGQRVTVLRGHRAGVRSVEFSPDGERLVSAGRDGVLRFWDGHTGRELFELKGHHDFVDAVTFSPDGRQVVSASRDGSVKFWGADAPRQPISFDDHDVAECAKFSADGRQIASLGRNDQALIVRDAETGRVLLKRIGPWGQEAGIAFHPQGQVLAVPEAEYAICLFDLQAGSSAKRLVGHNVRVHDVAFSQDGSFLVSADDSGVIWQWDLASGGVGRELANLTGRVYSIALSPDNRWLVTAGPGNVATVFAIDSPKRKRFTLSGHTGQVYTVAFSPDGSRIATASHDTTARLWDAHDGRLIMTLAGHTNLVQGVAFNADGSRIAAGSLSGQIKLWDTATGQEVLTLKGHESGIQTVTFSPDGSLLLSASMDGRVKRWDARPLEEIK